jgi:hypothetical protein
MTLFGANRGLSPVLRPVLRALLLAALLAPAAAARAGDAAPPRQAQGVTWRPVDLVYEVHAGGAHVFTVDLSAALDGSDYALDVAMRTDGTLAWFLDFTLRSRVSGRPAEPGMAPARFRTESLWRGRERWVELSYDGAGAPAVTAEPPPEEDERDRVPDDLRAGTVDPLSAALALIYAVAWDEGCELSLKVFDGRRRFDAHSRDDGEREVAVGALSPYGGPARACAVTLDPVTGFKRTARLKPRQEDFVVYLRRVAPGTPPLPVRVEAETRFGGVRVHLVDLKLRPESG